MKKYESILSLLKQLAVLSKRGVGGERENARAKVELLMAKHGITWGDLDDVSVSKVAFPYKTSSDRQLILQCAAALGLYNDTRKAYSRVNTRSVFLEVTEVEAVDLRNCIEHHRPLLRKHLDEASVSYFLANKLVPPQSSSAAELSAEQLASYLRSYKMAQHVQPSSWRRALNASAAG